MNSSWIDGGKHFIGIIKSEIIVHRHWKSSIALECTQVNKSSPNIKL